MSQGPRIPVQVPILGQKPQEGAPPGARSGQLIVQMAIDGVEQNLPVEIAQLYVLADIRDRLARLVQLAEGMEGDPGPIETERLDGRPSENLEDLDRS